MSHWQTVQGRVVWGHRVASGLNQNPRFPNGTLYMQAPHFQALGFDLGKFFRGTLNISIAPLSYKVVKAPFTFANVKWHPTEPAETFSFFDVRFLAPNCRSIEGCIYYPHPETKPEHFHPPGVLELLLPFVDGLCYGSEVTVAIPATQIVIDPPPAQP